MILSISGVVLLGIICFLFFKKDGLTPGPHRL